MKTIKLFGVVLLTVLLSVSFSSCSKSDEETNEHNYVLANGEGVFYDTVNNTTEKVRVWINDYVIYNYAKREDEPFYSNGYVHEYLTKGLSFYNYLPYTMDNVYELIGAGVDENTDFSLFIPSKVQFVQYCKNHSHTYKYVSRVDSGDFIFFNRTRDINY